MGNKRAVFTSLKEADASDWLLIKQESSIKEHSISKDVLSLFDKLKGRGTSYPIDRYEHSLQTATRAYKDGADDELVVVALLHDIGDTVAPQNHGEFAASLLRPYISETNCWLIENHEIFQGYYYYHFLGLDRNHRERFSNHPAYQRTINFCEQWDQCSFDPSYESFPISFFELFVEKVFSSIPWVRND